MQQVVGAFGRCAFVNRELGPDSRAVAGMEGVEKYACLPRDSHPPLICLLQLPSPLCVTRRN